MVSSNTSVWHGLTPTQAELNINYNLSSVTPVSGVKTLNKEPLFKYQYTQSEEHYKSMLAFKWHKPTNTRTIIFPSSNRGYPMWVLQNRSSSSTALLEYEDITSVLKTVTKSVATHYYQIWVILTQEFLSDKYYADIYTVDLNTRTLTKLPHQSFAIYNDSTKILTWKFNVHQDFDLTYIEEPTAELIDLLSSDFTPFPAKVSQTNIGLDKIQNFRITHINPINPICTIEKISTSVNQALHGFVNSPSKNYLHYEIIFDKRTYTKIIHNYETFYIYFYVSKLSNGTVSTGYNSVGNITYGHSMDCEITGKVPVCIEFSSSNNAKVYVGVRDGPFNNIFYRKKKYDLPMVSCTAGDDYVFRKGKRETGSKHVQPCGQQVNK